jgi:hypothetical protein
MAQTVSLLPVTSEARVSPSPIHVEFAVDKAAQRHSFFRVLWLYPVSIITSLLDTNELVYPAPTLCDLGK